MVGDVFGKPGRRALVALLPEIVDREAIDYVVVNVENAAGGFGVTPAIVEQFSDLPIDCFTTGNHVWDKREGVELLGRVPNLLRPHNYPPGAPGKGLLIDETAAGTRVGVLNLEGQVFMKALPSPFTAAEEALEDLEDAIVLVDFHAEATSEKQAMGVFLDGRVSAVVGTHTHVPTADARILPGGTAFITDLGMTGPYESIIGCRSDRVLKRFLTQRHVPFEVAKRDVRLASVILEIDEETKRAVSIRQLIRALP